MNTCNWNSRARSPQSSLRVRARRTPEQGKHCQYGTHGKYEKYGEHGKYEKYGEHHGYREHREYLEYREYDEHDVLARAEHGAQNMW